MNPTLGRVPQERIQYPIEVANNPDNRKKGKRNIRQGHQKIQ